MSKKINVKVKSIGISKVSTKETIQIPEEMDIQKKDILIYKPLLKWVGGKSQILEKVLDKFPKIINNYYEIFLGGGSVLFGLLNEIQKNNIIVKGNLYAYDVNEPLIYLYKNIQEKPNELYKEICKLIEEFNIYDEIKREKKDEIIKPKTIDEVVSKESYYYWIRKRYNDLSSDEKKTVLGSSLLLFLNKTCWRGVFRVGKNGFNVPYGNYKEPEIINKKHLMDINHLIKNVKFECKNFTESLQNIKKDDFVYMDPPYAPENETSFVGYADGGFGMEKHKELFEICHKIKNENIKWLMSNADVKLIRDNFTDNYKIESIVCRRTINSKNPDATTKEVFIEPHNK
jgi:DNA adenine methylase